jgi:hypothetical protein
MSSVALDGTCSHAALPCGELVNWTFWYTATAGGAVTYAFDGMEGVPYKITSIPLGTQTNSPNVKLVHVPANDDLLNGLASAVSPTTVDTYFVNYADALAKRRHAAGLMELRITGADNGAQGRIVITMMPGGD